MARLTGTLLKLQLTNREVGFNGRFSVGNIDLQGQRDTAAVYAYGISIAADLVDHHKVYIRKVNRS